MKLNSAYFRLEAQNRLHQIEVPIIGLTGGIATGKSTVSRILRGKGLALIDADKLVKDIYEIQESKDFIGAHFPEVMSQGEIQFPMLREKVFQKAEAKTVVENFIYSRLPAAFREAYERLGRPEFVIYDVPLLFEKHLAELVDLTVLVYAPRTVQRARLIERDGLEGEMAERILSQQLDIEEKKLRSELVIDNSRTEAELKDEVDLLVSRIFS